MTGFFWVSFGFGVDDCGVGIDCHFDADGPGADSGGSGGGGDGSSFSGSGVVGRSVFGCFVDYVPQFTYLASVLRSANTRLADDTDCAIQDVI